MTIFLTSPITNHCVEGVLIPNLDHSPPVEDHVLLGDHVKHVDHLGVGADQSQLSHLQTVPPGASLRDVEFDPAESWDEVG